MTPHYFAAETEVKDIGIEQMLRKIYSADIIDQSSSELKKSKCEIRSVEDRRFMKVMNR